MKFQQKCLGKMGKAASTENKTVLYVSHNMNTIRQLCTRCVVLDHGKIIFDGNVEKAIEIYMNNTRAPETSGVFTDADKDKRGNGKVKVNAFEILNKNGYILDNKESLRLALNYSSENGLKNVYLRTTFEFTDDTRVGTAITAKPIDFEKTQDGRKIFEIDTRHLAPGQYTVRMTFYCLNDFGSQELIEIINGGCSIVIDDQAERYHNLAWNNQWWGHAAFEDIVEVED